VQSCRGVVRRTAVMDNVAAAIKSIMEMFLSGSCRPTSTAVQVPHNTEATRACSVQRCYRQHAAGRGVGGAQKDGSAQLREARRKLAGQRIVF
jgi:hypothetical protein